MEFLKAVTTKVFNPNAIPVGTCIRVKECTLKNDFDYNAIVCGYDHGYTFMYVAKVCEESSEPITTIVYISSGEVEAGTIEIEPLVSKSNIKLEDDYSDAVRRVKNPLTVKQFKDHVNSIPEYLDGLNLIISKESVDGAKLMHHYTEATDCIYYDDEDEKRMYGGLLLELC
jgi:hypothetical protein